MMCHQKLTLVELMDTGVDCADVVEDLRVEMQLASIVFFSFGFDFPRIDKLI